MPNDSRHDMFEGWSGGGCSGTAPSCIVTMSAAQSVTATFGLAPNPPDNTQQTALALGVVVCGTGTSFNGATSGGSHGWAFVVLEDVGPGCTPAQLQLFSPRNDISMSLFDNSGQPVAQTAPNLFQLTTSGTYYIEVSSPTSSEDSWTLNIFA
jgi:hypothetical protein